MWAAPLSLVSNETPCARASKRRTHYDVVIRLDNGDVQTRSLDAMPPFKVGDRVRVVQGRPERDLAADRR